MTDHRQEIKDVLFRNEKPHSWLQRELDKKLSAIPGKKPVDIYRLLDGSKSVFFDVDVYELIQQIFREHGIIPTELDRTKRLRSKVIEINGIIASGLTLLNETMNEYLQDDELTFDEKTELMQMIERIENEYSRLSELKTLIKK